MSDPCAKANQSVAIRALWTVLLLWLVQAPPLNAQQFGALSYLVNGDGTVTIVSCHRYVVGAVTIPAVINGRPVAAVSGSAFEFCGGLTSVTFPESVTSIGGYGFLQCRNLTAIEVSPLNANYSSLDGVLFDKDRTTLLKFPAAKTGTYTLPGSVTAIDAGALASCTGVTAIGMPAGVTRIGDDAFLNCLSLTSLTVPASVTSIGSRAFSGCTSLTSIFIPAGVAALGDGAFRECKGLTAIEVDPLNPNYSSLDGVLLNKSRSQLIQFPEGRPGAWSIPNSITEIPEFAFARCAGLNSITIPGSVTSIGAAAFVDCASLTSISIPWGVTSIGGNTFWKCRGLVSVSIPDSVHTIDVTAFHDCASLVSVSIPASVTSLGENGEPFAGCTSLVTIAVDPLNPNYSSLDGVLMDKNQARIIQFPAARPGTWAIPNGVTEIRSGPFYGSTGLTSIVIPDTVTKIAAGAFQDCTGLTAITIPDSVTSIEANAFQGCTGLTTVNMGSGLTASGASAFAGCTGLTSVTLGPNVTRISSGSFEGCTSLTSIAIPPVVATIESFAFHGCTGLTAVTIPDSVVLLDLYAFRNCTALTAVTIPDSVTTIGYGAFQDCTALGSVSIGSHVTHIHDSAFQDCAALVSLTVPDSVTEIGWHAFNGCSSLVSLSLGSGVTRIGLFVLERCTGLEEIDVSPSNPNYSSVNGVLFDKFHTTLIRYPSKRGGPYAIPDTVVTIGGYTSVFEGCTGLTTVTIPANVTAIFDGFNGCTNLTAIVADGANPAFRSVDGVLFDKDGTALIRCPPGRTGTYSIPAGVFSINDIAFRGCAGLTSISVPSGTSTIRQGSFMGCTGLTSISFPNTMSAIGAYAFEDCTGLTSVSLPSSLTSVGHAAFRGCTGLISVTVGKGVTEIGNEAFRGCPSLTEFTVDALNPKYRSIDGVLFWKNPFRLLQVPARKAGHYAIPDGVTALYNFNEGPFDGCHALTSVFIPASVSDHNGVPLFRDCLNLTAIEVDPQNLYFSSLDGVLYDKVGVSSTTGISLLRFPPGRAGNLTVPAMVNYIPSDAFEGCTGLRSALFLGDAPDQGFTASDAPPGFTIYYYSDSLGFTSPKWWGYPTFMIDRTVHPAAEWLLTHSLPYNANLQDDPNGDGVNLLLAYALNLNPALNLPASLPVPEPGSEGITLSFHGISPGIAYRAETSTDLLRWTEEGVVVSAPGPDGRRTAAVAREEFARYLRLVIQASNP